jgi:hypothetical protein
MNTASSAFEPTKVKGACTHKGTTEGADGAIAARRADRLAFERVASAMAPTADGWALSAAQLAPDSPVWVALTLESDCF